MAQRERVPVGEDTERAAGDEIETDRAKGSGEQRWVGVADGDSRR